MSCKEGKEISQKSGKCVKICKPGTERNPKSGRCKKVSTRPGRVPPVIPISRNPTQRLCKNGRCKKVSTKQVTIKQAKSVTPKQALKSCKDGFEISHKSGKCVKICKSGTERNPKTGKCKKVSGTIRVPITHKSVNNINTISEPTPVPIVVPDNDCEVTNDEIDGFFSKDVENCIQELFCVKEEGKKFHEIFSDRRLPGESNCEALTRLIFPNFIRKITKLLGKGVQGSVFEAIDLNGNQVAIKITIASDAQFKKELRIAKKMESLGVGIKILGHSTKVIKDSGKPNHKFIMMEKIKGTLLELVNERPFSDTELKDITDEIVRIIKLLSDNKLVHGDMHANNIGYILQEDGSIKLLLIDYGLSQEVSMPRADLIQAIRVTWGLSIDEIRVRYDKFIREKAEEVLKIRNVYELAYDTVFPYSLIDDGRYTEEELDDEITMDYRLDMTDAGEGKSRKYPFPPFG